VNTPVGRTVCSVDQPTDWGGDDNSLVAELLSEHHLAEAGQP